MASGAGDRPLDSSSERAELETLYKVQALVPVGLHAHTQIIEGYGSLVLPDLSV
jgi:hypothetical protein